MENKKKYGFSADRRIKKSKEFQKIQNFGTKIFTKQFLLIYIYNELEHSRLGIAVSKKVHKKANKRNLVKRKIREIFRLNQDKFIKPIDLVIIARKDSHSLEYSEFDRQIIGSLKYNKLMN